MPTLHSHTHCQAAQANATTQAWQRVCLPHRRTKTTDKPTDEEEHRTDNNGFAKKRVQWLIEHSTSHQLLCYVDSFELRNPPERKARKRCCERSVADFAASCRRLPPPDARQSLRGLSHIWRLCEVSSGSVSALRTTCLISR